MTCITIRDRNAQVIGAASFVNRGTYVHIHYLGSRIPGTGRQLIDMIETIAQGKPLTVLSDAEAVGFYKRVGFRITRNCGGVVKMRKKP